MNWRDLFGKFLLGGSVFAMAFSILVVLYAPIWFMLVFDVPFNEPLIAFYVIALAVGGVLGWTEG